MTDPVTGAMQRADLEPSLEAAVAAGTPFAVFLFDVDFFKTVNDAYGHRRGDEVLRQLATRIGELSRANDVLFRYGGDEFVLLLPAIEPDEAVRAAHRLAAGVRDEVFSGDPALNLSISLGVASFPGDATDAATLLTRADQRNYQAKRRGRGRAVADDFDAEPAEGETGRLWERDAALATASSFLEQLASGTRGALRVVGPPGVGHTRFLAQVEAVAALRRVDVMVADLGTAVPDPLPAHVQGVVFATERPDAHTVLPVIGTAELLPWSPAALRIWLRTTLFGEPSRTLVNWLAGQTGGLPAKAAPALDRLRRTGGLVSTEDGGWTVAAHVLAAPKRRSRLPVPMTKLVGRDAECRRVIGLLGNSRLVTLVGPGGIGKTRLSLSIASTVADEYRDGAVFVPLADATDTDLVVAALAQALGVAEAAGQPLLETVCEHLSGTSMLLVLDNFEQALDAATVVSEILAAAPDVVALVSSRERLSLYGEQVYKVPALTDEPALALFEQRARAADADFALSPDTLPSAAALCRRLDGLPLAIELAAAHADRLAPAELLAVISAHLDALGEGPRDLPARQQTLRGTVDWSYALLEEDQRRLFCALAAFASGCTPDAVLAVVAEDNAVAKQLDALVDKSLLVVEDEEDGPRYRMLETIRAYAHAQLDTEPDADEIVARHAAFYLRFAEASAVGLTGPQQASWAGRIEREYQNVRAAFTRADRTTAARICLGLWRYWRNGSHLGEGRDWLDRILGSATELDDGLAAQLLHAGAVLAATQDDHERASMLATESLNRARAVGDLTTIAQANNALGIAAIGAGDYHAAVWHFRESLAIWQDMEHAQGTAAAFGNLTKVSLRLGDVAAADRYAAECLHLERANGNTRGILLALECVGQIRLAQGDPASARKALEESLTLSRSVGDAFGAAMALHQLGLVAHAEGDESAAVRLLAEAAMRRYEVGDRLDLAISLDVLGHVLAERRPAVAARLLGAADEVRHKHRLPVPPDGETFRVATVATLHRVLAESAEEIARGRAIPLDLVLDEAQELSSATGAP